MKSLLVLLFIALFAISNCYSELVLSIQSFQYSQQLCNSTNSDSSIESYCIPPDWTNLYYITFGECVLYQNVPSIFTLLPSNNTVKIQTFSPQDKTCTLVQQSYTIPLRECLNNCPGIPTYLTLVERENAEIPVNTAVKAWFKGPCVEGGWTKTFKLIDIALAYKCINTANKYSSILICDPKILSISYDGVSNDCNTYGNTINYPLGLTCGLESNVDFFCNS